MSPSNVLLALNGVRLELSDRLVDRFLPQSHRAELQFQPGEVLAQLDDVLGALVALLQTARRVARSLLHLRQLASDLGYRLREPVDGEFFFGRNGRRRSRVPQHFHFVPEEGRKRRTLHERSEDKKRNERDIESRTANK